ncbi:MAG TPA: UbiD family decarboxylase [Dehalococcoidia bacterium]|nr:UbiD family decarboxylase [Dehalococcoidia bacterium]
MADLREWLAKVEELGELRTLRGVNWDLEMGVITEMAGRQLGKPAILFDDIPGYPPGFRVIVNTTGSLNRFALTSGFPVGIKEVEMVQEWRRFFKRMDLLPPRLVDSGPVMENVDLGEDVDLLKFPIPKWHEKDGGRYIGTGDVIITRGPDGGWVNLGTYRAMLHDRNHIGLAIEGGHHGRWHMNEWFAKGEPMPMAVAIGMDPLLLMVGCSEVAWGISEYDYAGAIRGKPVDVIAAPITGLPIPADAEIVLEGFVDPEERRLEGPFGEYPGYYGAGIRPLPVLRVEAVYYRNDPILLGSPPLRPQETQYLYRQTLRAGLIWDALEAAGVPDVTGVWSPLVFMVVVSIRQRYPGHAKQAARVAAQVGITARSMGRYTIVVDDDIDVADMDEVLWAMCTRVDPDRDIEVLRGCLSTPLDPMGHPDRTGDLTMPRMIIDAARPYEWRDRFPEVVASSPELKQRVLSRWSEMLQGLV